MTESASKAFAKTRRRADVPEWFQPMSYVAAGLLVLSVLIAVVFSPARSIGNAAGDGTDQRADGRQLETTSPPDADMPAGAPDDDAGGGASVPLPPVDSTGNGTDDGSGSAPADEVPAAVAPDDMAPDTDTADDEDLLAFTDARGNVQQVPVGAVDVGAAAAEALFTGNFDHVALVAGATAPAVLSTWDDPHVDGPSNVSTFSSEAYALTFDVTADPDGNVDPPRTTRVVVERSGAGWAYQPG